MAKLTSHRDRQGAANEEYRNRRVAIVSSHATPRSTRETGRREERDRLLRDRVIGHVVVGVAAFVVFTALLSLFGTSLTTFALAMVAFYVGLRSFTFAISIGLGDAWGWDRDGGMAVPLRLSDRVVLVGAAWVRRRSEAAVDIPPVGAVRALPPQPPG